MHTLTAGHAPWAQHRGSPWTPGYPGPAYPHCFVLFCSQPPQPLEALCTRCANADEPIALWTTMQCGEARMAPRGGAGGKLSPSEVSQDTRGSHTSVCPGPLLCSQDDELCSWGCSRYSKTFVPEHPRPDQGTVWCLGDSLHQQRRLGITSSIEKKEVGDQRFQGPSV